MKDKKLSKKAKKLLHEFTKDCFEAFNFDKQGYNYQSTEGYQKLVNYMEKLEKVGRVKDVILRELVKYMKKLEKVERVKDVILREMMMYAKRWRASWLNFDGRTLRDQLSSLKEWAECTLNDEEYSFGWKTDEEGEFIAGTRSYEEV